MLKTEIDMGQAAMILKLLGDPDTVNDGENT